MTKPQAELRRYERVTLISMADLIKIITAIKVAVASEAQPDAQPLTRSNPTHKHPAGCKTGCLIPRLTTN